MLGELRRSFPDLDLVTWVLASALILPLLAAELRVRSAWRYQATRWSFVFPLGMYAVASTVLGNAERIPQLRVVGRTFLVLAVAAWAVALLGLAHHVCLRRRAGVVRSSSRSI